VRVSAGFGKNAEGAVLGADFVLRVRIAAGYRMITVQKARKTA
jgi:hypothetical protein